jgi:hypothetical protein
MHKWKKNALEGFLELQFTKQKYWSWAFLQSQFAKENSSRMNILQSQYVEKEIHNEHFCNHMNLYKRKDIHWEEFYKLTN